MRHPDHRFGLVAVLGGEFPVSCHGLAEGVNLLVIARGVRGDLGGLFAIAASSFKIFPNLLTPRARRIEILLRIAFNLRCAAPSGGDFIAEMPKTIRQFGLVDGRSEMLRGKEALRLQCAVLAILSLGDIEDHSVRVELWSGVAVYRTGGVVLKFGGCKFGRHFDRMVPAHARHCVMLQMLKCCVDGIPVRLAHPVIAAYKRRQRNRLRSGECGIPPGTMFHRFDRGSIGVFVFVRGPLPDKLFPGLWVLSLTEPCKVLRRYRTRQSKLLR